METGVFAHERMAKQCNEIGRWITGGKVMSRQPSGLRDLVLTVACIEKCAAKLGRRQRDRITPLGSRAGGTLR